MKRIISLITVVLIITCFITPALAVKGNEPDFVLNIDVWNTAEQVYVIDNIEFRVLASDSIMPRAGLSASKTVQMRDLYNDAILGSVYIYASGVYDGNLVAVSNQTAYILNRPSTSDLRTTGLTVQNNGTSLVTVSAGIAYTGSNGRAATGFVNLNIRGDGTYY